MRFARQCHQGGMFAESGCNVCLLLFVFLLWNRCSKGCSFSLSNRLKRISIRFLIGSISIYLSSELRCFLFCIVLLLFRKKNLFVYSYCCIYAIHYDHSNLCQTLITFHCTYHALHSRTLHGFCNHCSALQRYNGTLSPQFV